MSIEIKNNGYQPSNSKTLHNNNISIETEKKPKSCEMKKEYKVKPPYKSSKKKENQSLVIKTIVVLTITITAILLVFIFAKDYVELVAEWFSTNFGITGVFFFVMALDFFPIPLFPVDSIFAVTISWNPFILLSAICIASMIAGFFGYLMGRNLKRVRIMRRLIPLLLNKGRILIRKNALAAIIIGGLTPIPYATISWLAGYLNVKPHIYLIGSLSRIPRYVIYFLLIRGSMELIL